MIRIHTLIPALRRLRDANDEEGQALAEYSLVLALIAVVAATALTALGMAITGTLDEITAALS